MPEPYADAELDEIRRDFDDLVYGSLLASRLLATVDAGREREAEEVARLEFVVAAVKAERDRLKVIAERASAELRDLYDERDRLRKALERLASTEGFIGAAQFDPASLEWIELSERGRFARAALRDVKA